MTDLPSPTRSGMRTKLAHRCAGCWLPMTSCVCASLPRIAVRTRVVIVMHHVEARRASNTGRLAARILGAEVRIRGAKISGFGAKDAEGDPKPQMFDQRFGAKDAEGDPKPQMFDQRSTNRGPSPAPPNPPLPAGRRLLLFPADGARQLTAEDDRAGPVVLVVPDGNWKQASRVLHRDSAAVGAEIVTLPAGPPSRYALRRRPNEAALSTFEAIARALAILESPEIEGELMRAFDLFVARTLVLRGGIPAASS